MDASVLILFVGLYFVGSMLSGAYVSVQKSRPMPEGVIFGLLFGPIGVLIAASLPDAPPRPEPQYLEPPPPVERSYEHRPRRLEPEQKGGGR